MPSAFSNLEKILAFEQNKGCQDIAVIGGLEKFLSDWAKQFKDESPDTQVRAKAIVDSLAGYGKASATERQQALAEALALARGRKTMPPSPPEQVPVLAIPELEAVQDAAEQEDEEDLEIEPVNAVANARGTYGIEAPVTRLQNVGPKYAAKLERLGVRTIRDLLYHFPYRYDDYRNLKKIAELVYGQEATVAATVLDCKQRNIRNNLHITNVLLGDTTGTLQISFFNQPFLAKAMRHGMQIVISGRVDRQGNRPTFSHPVWEPLTKELVHTGRIVPVYPLTEGISSRSLRKMIKGVVEYWADKVPDPLPAGLRKSASLVDLATALREIHFPTTWQKGDQGRRRLAFDEFLMIQIGVLRQRRKWRSVPGKPLPTRQESLNALIQSLPFELTGAQRRALDEILRDIAQPTPMSRLLQGDVGSGKTVVATAAALTAVSNGAQAAIMAPTEILAEQHFKTIARLFQESKLPASKKPRVGLLIGSLRARDKDEMRAKLANGEIQVAIGTHALIQGEVQFQDLVLAVIDEQHRFGVSQRAAIRQKGYNPHILVMSATPIPRTLALTVYGDLDLSIIDELPPGRQEIKTKWLVPAEREGAYSFIRKQVSQGRQAFVICPLIEESESIDAKAAVEEYDRLRTEVYPDLRVGLVHGKLRPSEKDAVMAEFRDGRIDILVATSVVEVGIDVPNATVMLIEGADRFGLAQLHQFRGRVGRGAERSYCLLLAEQKESAADQRLQVIENTHNGFVLAEEDLKMRGPGEFFGTRQSGLPDLKVAKLSDLKLLELARHTALELFERDPDLQAPEHRLLAESVRRFWREEGELS